MRARLITLFFLLFFLWLASYVYWYFMVSRESHLLVHGPWDKYSVSLKWTFGYSFLPLADKALSFSKECTSSCLIGPIVPARYQLTITKDGYIETHEELSLRSWEKKEFSYLPKKDFVFTPLSGDNSPLTSWEDERIQKENMRFTYAIDISPYERIGYISASDSEKLLLSNFSTGTSMLIHLDRSTGETYILRKGMNISGFYFSREKPAFFDSEGKSYSIE